MKKAKRFLALVLGLIMVLGCMSVSASDALTVTEKPAKMIYENDFSGDTVDTDHIELGAIANQSSGAIRTDNESGHVATFYAAKEGITDSVTFEFNVYEYNMKDVGGAQVQMFFLNKDENIVGDLRWYNANPKYFKIIQRSGSTAPAATFNNDSQSAHVKAKLNPETNSFAVWINGTELVSEAEGPAYAKVADFSEITGVKINVSNAGMSVVLSNLKIYTDESQNVPAIWEEVSHEDFEKNVDSFTATSNELIPEINSNVTYTHKNGALTMKTTQAGAGTKVYLQPNNEALTGKYVVEMVLKNASQTTTSSGYHRIALGSLSSYYLQWLPNTVLQFRPTTASTFDNFTSQMANYKANGDTLKVTLCFDSNAYTVKAYFNDIYAFEKDYKDDQYKVERTSIAYINFNLYTGQIDLADLRVYRPLETDSTTGLKIEEKGNEVKIATAEAKAGNIYFAKYDSDAENGKTLESLGVAPLNLVPGKIYTVDKTNWIGAKAFYWDNNLTPIIAPWELN